MNFLMSGNSEKIEFQQVPDKKFTSDELIQFNASDDSKPVYLAIKGIVYDVSSRRDLYVEGRPYHVFAGRDASRALAKTSIDIKDCVPEYSDLPEEQIKVLDNWEVYYQKKYKVVGSTA